MAEHVGEGQQQEFLALEGVTWSNPSIPWEDRGLEWAAEALAYGLSEQLGLGWCVPGGRGEKYLEGFQLLTGRNPLVPCA